LAGKDHVSVDLSLEKETGKITIVQQTQAKPNYVWVGWVATGVITTGAVLTGILAVDSNSKLNDLKNQRDVTSTQLHDEQTKRNSLALATDILAGCAVNGAGVSLYFTLTTGKTSEPPRVGVQAGVGPGSLYLSGVF